MSPQGRIDGQHGAVYWRWKGGVRMALRRQTVPLLLTVDWANVEQQVQRMGYVIDG
jgi:hypothetical protein